MSNALPQAGGSARETDALVHDDIASENKLDAPKAQLKTECQMSGRHASLIPVQNYKSAKSADWQRQKRTTDVGERRVRKALPRLPGYTGS